MKLRDLKFITITDLDMALVSSDISICHSNLEYLLTTYLQLSTFIDEIKIYKRIVFLIQKIIELDDDIIFSRKQILNNANVILKQWERALKQRTPSNQESDLLLYRHRLLKQEYFLFALRLINQSFEELLEPNQRYLQVSQKSKNRIAHTYTNFMKDSNLKGIIRGTLSQQLICESLKYLSYKAALLPHDNLKQNIQQFYEFFSLFCSKCSDHYEQNRIVMMSSVINSLSVVIQLQVRLYLSEVNLQKCYELVKFFKFLLTNFRLKKMPLLVSYIRGIDKYTCFLREKTSCFSLLIQMIQSTVQKLQKSTTKVKKSPQKQNIFIQPTYLSKKMTQKQNLRTDISRHHMKSKSIFQIIDSIDKNKIDMLKIRGSTCLYQNKPRRFQFCSRQRMKSNIQSGAKVSLSINQSQMIKIKTQNLNKKKEQQTKVALYQVFLTQHQQRRHSFGIIPRESKLNIFQKSMIHLIIKPNKE